MLELLICRMAPVSVGNLQTQATVDQLERGIAPLNDYVFSLRDAFQMFIVHQVI